jgi:7-cyano-7-deazaguanine synthase in queuosine biosynthesis/intein/homing endonuclease
MKAPGAAVSQPRAVVLVSGGLDSSTALAIAQSQGFECYALSVAYGQRHVAELDAAARVAAALGAREHRVMQVDLAGIGGSALTDSDIQVPESPALGIPVTYVPARNTILLGLALAWAEVLNAKAVFIGVNAVDYSVSGDTRVWLRGGGSGARLMRIEDVCNLPPEHDYETLAVELSSLQITWKPLRGRHRHEVSGKRCFRLRLERGQRIEITEDHSLFTIDAGGDLITIRGDEIVLGTPLVVPFDLSPQAGSWDRDLETIDLSVLGRNISRCGCASSVTEVDGFLTNRLHRIRVPVRFPITDDFLRIVGLWLAEGGKHESASNRSLQFSIGGLEGAPDLLRRYFISYGARVSKSAANDFDFRLASSTFHEVFRRLELFGTAKLGTKRFPDWFWSLSQRQRRVVIAGFWDGDGCQVWKGEAPIHQKSHQLIQELYHCLLLDGIFPTVKRVAHDQLRLALTRRSDFSRFVELYPLWHRAKQESLKAAAMLEGRDKTTGMWKCEGLWKAVAGAEIAPGLKSSVYNSGGKYDRSVRAQRSAFTAIPSLDRLRDSKLAFLRVVEIEPVAHKFMYDLSVDGAQNFIANGFLAHNSGYPDCRPEFIEAFERMATRATKAGVEGKPCRIYTPLIALSKADIIREGVRLGVDFALTVSCYQADSEGRACGRCDSCRLRAAGFSAAGMTDPTRYA